VVPLVGEFQQRTGLSVAPKYATETDSYTSGEQRGSKR
jgi:hypothetical protein